MTATTDGRGARAPWSAWPDAAAVPVLLFLAAKLTALVVNLRWFPTLRPRRETADASTALLVPLRNETDRIAASLPAFLAAGFSEIVLLDDESTDGTGALVRDLLRATDASRARLATGAPRPPGWIGKTWACAQLADHTRADVLVFCDADVLLAPGAARALIGEMNRQRADAFSVFSRHITGGWAERLLVPLIVDVVLCFLPFGLLRAPVPAAATAHGALLAFRRSAYDAIGGFSGVRGELVEDVALARRIRRSGLRLGLCLGGDIARIRMYRGYRDVVVGLGRGLGPVVGGRRWLVVAGWAWHLLAYSWPLAAAARSRRWRLAAALGIAERLVLEAKTGGRDWTAAGLIGLSPIAAAPVVAQALRRRQTWRGRTYG